MRFLYFNERAYIESLDAVANTTSGVLIGLAHGHTRSALSRLGLGAPQPLRERKKNRRPTSHRRLTSLLSHSSTPPLLPSAQSPILPHPPRINRNSRPQLWVTFVSPPSAGPLEIRIPQSHLGNPADTPRANRETEPSRSASATPRTQARSPSRRRKPYDPLYLRRIQ